MEDFGGISLKEWVINQENPLSLQEFLEISISLCNTLDILYHERIIHKDIKPANILINPQTKEIKLIDFSIASLLPRETPEIQNANALAGTIAYISPEQTGRMNRGIDYRSDFYSLGVTFYELLTNRLPFASSDPMEMLHCHLAKNPIPIHEINPHIPVILSDIINKLMAKTAEERYQSALGIKYDLEICLNQLQQTGKIAPFILGSKDICDRFIIPEKLYGREKEVAQLLAAFARVSTGSTEMILVAGFSGMGKTSVINEVYKPIVRQRGYFIKGKYDQFQQNIACSAFVQAFRNLMEQLLSENDLQLQNWQHKILEVVGENGQILIDVIPELENIIGKQPIPTELSGTAAQNRFNLLLQNFVKVFTTKEHPLVIFLDDLQWADDASLKLLKILMQDVEYLLVLGAYRDNEVSSGHSLKLKLNEIIRTGATVNTITLSALSELDVNKLIANTLNCELLRSANLAKLVYQKTTGNPFFTAQFLKSLYNDKLISFDRESGYWQCDIVKIKALVITDNIVEFMALQLQKLPIKTQNILKLAACIGVKFDLQTLAIVSENSAEVAATELWAALQEGLIIPTTESYKFFIQLDSACPAKTAANPTYRFLHDRVQQAAYSLIPEQEKQATHLKIGQLLLDNISVADREENIFAIVNQLNIGQSLITQLSQRDQLIQLNLIAAKKAKAATAHCEVIKYLETVIALLPENSWHSQFELTLFVYEEAVESAYLCIRCEQMEYLAEIALAHTDNLTDKIRIYEIMMLATRSQGQLLESIQMGLELLQLLEIEFPAQPKPADIEQALEQTLLTWKGRSISSLLDEPVMSDRHKLMAMRILTLMIPSAYQAVPMLMPLLICKQINLCLAGGNSAISTFAYAEYGLLLCGIVGDVNTGYQFGQLALAILDRFQLKAGKCRTYFVVHSYISHWQESLSHQLPCFQEAYQTGLETGDLESSALTAQMYCTYAYFAGHELATLAVEMETYRQKILHIKQEHILKFHLIYYQTVLNLLGDSVDPCQLEGEIYGETEALPMLQQSNLRTALYYLYYNKTYLCYLLEQYPQAKDNAILAASYTDAVVGMFATSLLCFYSSLINLQLCASAAEMEKIQYLDTVVNNQKKLQYWAENAPTNHLHKFYLVEAEYQRVLGQKAAAIELYDRAISGAKANGYIQEEALGNELAAKFYLDWGRQRLAEDYMIEAYYCYARWGAKVKAADLERRYPQLLAPILQQPHSPLSTNETIFALDRDPSTNSTTSSSSAFGALDLATILKASQTLSGEIELEKLLSSLLAILIENAGATKGVLILSEEDNLLIQGSIIQGTEAIVLQRLPIEDSQDIPLRLIYQVKRHRQTTVILEATTDPTLVNDPYVISHQPKSILCSSILHQGKLLGILYLENNLVTGAFTSDRVEILNLLSAQAAISLENARLYELERERFQSLASKTKILAFRAEIDSSLIRAASLPEMLQTCTEIMVQHLDATFARFWTVNPAENMLELQASAGLYTHIDGPHSRVPIGKFKIGLIAEECRPHLTNDVMNDPRVGDKEWAKREGMQSFAGYPLIFNYQLLGVVGIFSRQKLTQDTLTALESVSSEIAIWIARNHGELALKQSEQQLHQRSQELEQTLQDLQQAQLQMIQNEKMSALGNLVAGVAHEMNNPLGFISSSLQQAKPSFSDIFAHLRLYQEHLPIPGDEIADHAEEIDLEYYLEDLPKMIDSMIIACSRLENISTSLRTFSRSDKDYKVPFNIHEGIDSTILILKHRLKANAERPEIEVIKNYGNLPQIECFPGQLNQVFMNILANAIDCLDESNIGRTFQEIKANPNRIIITTATENQAVNMTISDNGQGMSEEVQQKIFDHLFTTKSVGKGTGLGLAIARQIVVEKHQGQITVNSTPNQGTEFIITLPL
jgi:predicted ATPase/signal transduction histidine kinase